jgi:predicted nucleic acid-binding protein
MPATTIAFADVGRMPRQVYVDTSFVKALMDWTPGAGPRIGSSRAFYDRAQRENVRMWTSPLTVEEIVWAFVRNALFAEMPRFEVKTINEFKRQRRGDYDRALTAIQPDVGRIFDALMRLKVTYRFPNENSGFTGNWGAAVVKQARQLSCTYSLETADAFHAAAAFVAGNPEVVSLDEGFRALDGFTVYFAG